MNIKVRISVWYCLMMVLMAVLFLFYAIRLQETIDRKTIHARLLEEVYEAEEYISVENGEILIDRRQRFLREGVSIIVYDGGGNKIAGSLPGSFTEAPELDENSLRTLTDEKGREWFVFDDYDDRDGEEVWIRGVARTGMTESRFDAVQGGLLTGLLIMVLAAFAGGYFLTNRAFAPVRRIIRTVEEISRDGDVSRRIEPASGHGTEKKSGGDEIVQLTRTFNSMFDRLEENRRNEKRFTADVSHELRTPLSVIRAQSEYALHEPDRAPEALEVIRREAGRMSTLVNQLLMLMRGDEKRLEMEREDVDLSRLCREIAEVQALTAEENSTVFSAQIEDGLHVRGDEGMLMRIVLNLLSNAFRYGKPEGEDGKPGCTPQVRLSLGKEEQEGEKQGGGFLRGNRLPAQKLRSFLGERRAPRDSARAKKDNSACILCVEDNGRGIPPEEIERIWDRFYQAGEGARSEDSSGLGLSIVRTLTEVHGGEAWAESTPGAGSRFYVRLPLEEGPG